MSGTERHSGLCKWAVSVMMANADALADVPAQDEFYLSELSTEESKTLVKRLRTTEAVNSREVRKNGGIRVSMYELSRPAKKRRKNILEDRYTPLPCDHAGLRSTSDGYECCFEACGAVYSREEVENER